MKSILRHWPILLLALWFGGMTMLLDQAVALFSERTTANPSCLSEPAPWRHARLFVDPDSCTWLAYARDLREAHCFRVRHTHMDNTPYGRPVHWAQLPVWGLCGIAATLEAAGIPPPDALELAGRVLLPLLGFVTFSVLWLFLRRRIPSAVAGLAVLSLAVMLFWNYHPLRPDHHGFHIAAATAFLVPLLFSSYGFAAPGWRNRLAFIVSGVFGGIALWLGATVFYFALAAATLAAALAILPRPVSTIHSLPTLHPSSLDPIVWRLWGLSGATTSIIFWLLEYAPSHISMRLEPNQPLYALSFLGIGECLCLLARFRHDSATRLSSSFLVHASLAMAAAAALPALVLFGPASWYIPRSALMIRLHARHILEFLPLHVLCAGENRSLPFVLLPRILPALCALPFLLVRPLRRSALFAMGIFAVFLPLYFFQNRWEPFAMLASVLVLLEAAASTRPSRLRAPLLCMALLIPLCGALWRNLSPLPAYFRGTSFDPAALHAFQCRALAMQFRPVLDDPAVTRTPRADAPAVLAPADIAPFLYYYARIPSVASYYWENLPGNAAAAAAFADSAPGAPTAQAIVEDRRISHLLMFEGTRDAMLYDDLQTGVFSRDHAATTLAGILSGANPGAPIPSWLGVDPALNRLANPPLSTYVPPARRFATHPFTLRIYSLRPASELQSSHQTCPMP